MKSPGKRLFLPLLLTGLLPSPLALSDGIGASIGMHGVAIEYEKTFSDMLGARFTLSDMPLERDIEESDIEFEVEYDRTNAGVILDYHPFAGSFHISGGVYVGDHNWNMEASANNGEYAIGEDTYTSSNLQLSARVAYAKSAPYLGIGWGNTLGETGLSGNLDIGILYVGSPNASFHASGVVSDGTITADVASFPEFQENLEIERAELESELEDFEFMPVIQFGLAYRF